MKVNSNEGVDGMIGIDTKAPGVAGTDGIGLCGTEFELNYKLEETKLYGTVDNVSVPLHCLII